MPPQPEPDPDALAPDDAFAAIRDAAGGREAVKQGRLDRDDFGDARFTVRLERMGHLDADALSDRLQAWIHRQVEPEMPGASAAVSFDHARPAEPGDGGVHTGNEWVGIEAHFTLDLTRPAVTPESARAWVDHVPRFLEVVAEEGRPAGWRDPTVGNIE